MPDPKNPSGKTLKDKINNTGSKKWNEKEEDYGLFGEANKAVSESNAQEERLQALLKAPSLNKNKSQKFEEKPLLDKNKINEKDPRLLAQVAKDNTRVSLVNNFENRTLERDLKATAAWSKKRADNINNYKSSLESIIENDITNLSDDIFGLIDIGDPIAKEEGLVTYQQLLNNPDLTAKVKAEAKARYKMFHPNKDIDQYFIDAATEDVFNNFIAKERKEQELLVSDKEYEFRKNNNYGSFMTVAERGHIESLSSDERMIASNIKLAKSLQKILNADEGTYTDEKVIEAQNKMNEITPILNSKLKEYNEKYTFWFDNKTGRNLSKAEVDSRKASGDNETMTDREAELTLMQDKYKDMDAQTLERAYFAHSLKWNDLQQDLNSKRDVNIANPEIRKYLFNKGYAQEGTIFKGVKIDDLLNFPGSDKYKDEIETALNKGVAPGKPGQATLSQDYSGYMQRVRRQKAELEVERRSLVKPYLLNVDPKSLQDNLATSFGENLGASLLGAENTEKIFGISGRKEKDQIQQVLAENNVQLSKEQEKNFERDWTMKLSETTGYMSGELVKLALSGGVVKGGVSALGWAPKLAELGKSKKALDQVLFHSLNAVKEEAIFKGATLGESKDFGGAGFYLGGALMNKLVPFRFQGAKAALNPAFEKLILGGAGMTVGSEAAAVSEAIVDELKGNKAFQTSIEELYGETDVVFERALMNFAVGNIIGVKGMKLNDFKSIAAKRELLYGYNKKIRLGDYESKAEKTRIENKVELLEREIALADKAFNSMNIGAQTKVANEAQLIVDNKNASQKEKAEAADLIARTIANKVSAEKEIKRNFEAAKLSEALGMDVKLKIINGKEAAEPGVEFNKESSTAEFQDLTNTIVVDISQYVPGKMGHEIGHAMLKAAYKNSPEAITKLKDAIVKDVNSRLEANKYEFKSDADGKPITFEQRIEELYGKQQTAEEFVTNTIELLQTPAVREILLDKGFIAGLKRHITNTAEGFGIDIGSKRPIDLSEKNLNRASEVLEFLYDLGSKAEGSSASALKRKFEKFKNLVVDGKKLVNENTGNLVVSTEGADAELRTMQSTKMLTVEKSTELSENIKEIKELAAQSEALAKTYNKDFIKSPKQTRLEQKVIDEIKPIVDRMITNRTKALYDPIADEAKRNVTRAEFKESMRTDIETMVLNEYNGSQELEKFIVNRSHLRANNLAKRLGIESIEQGGIKGDVENIKDLYTEETADQSFEDTSSPEEYSRLSQKRASETLGFTEAEASKPVELAKKLLNSTKLENLDAKAIGSVPLPEGGSAKVAMLESNKARITYPDGKVETITARSPKIVEQHLKAPEKSFEKADTFKEVLAEDFKNAMFNDLSKKAGNLINNVKATPEYAMFVDKAFPLFKDYISQASVNKRFAKFKEPYIDKATGKQAREKTAAGNPVFKKKNITLAEWRKYFLADGTERIDGKRRSLIDALATEMGFDATMHVLGNEAMREQIESRQSELQVGVVENYIAVIAKQLDRGIFTTKASNGLLEVVRKYDSKSRTEKELQNILYRMFVNEDGTPKTIKELGETALGSLLLKETEFIANEDINNQINILSGNKVNEFTTDKMVNLGAVFAENGAEGLQKDNIKELSNKSIESAEATVGVLQEVYSYFPEIIEFITPSKDTKLSNGVIARFFGFDGVALHASNKDSQFMGRKDFARGGVQSKNNTGKIMLNNSNFTSLFKGLAGKNHSKLSPRVQKMWAEFSVLAKNNSDFSKRNSTEKIKEKNKKNITFLANTKDGLEKIAAIQLDPNLSTEARKANIMKIAEEYGLKAEAEVKQAFINAFMSTISEVRAKKNGAEVDRFVEGISAIFLNNSLGAFRKMSNEKYFDLRVYITDAVKNEHLEPKTALGADTMTALHKGELTAEKIKELFANYDSLMGSKEGQMASDKVFGSTVGKASLAKAILSNQLSPIAEIKTVKDALQNIIDITTGKDMWETVIQETLLESAGVKVNKTMQSRDIPLDRSLGDMLERKTGIPSASTVSPSMAYNTGRNKGKFRFFVPPNAEDFAGLLYDVYGRGKQGDKDMALIKKEILDPYERGENAISSYKQRLATDYKAMEKSLDEIGGEVSKEAKKEIEDTGYNSDQAVRVHIWNKLGYDIPGIEKSEVDRLSSIVENDNRLRTYSEGILDITKTEDKFPKPDESWYGSNIKYDLYSYATEGVRKEMLTEWRENMKEMFTPENYNKLEAAFGSSYVKNFKEIVKRMETGKQKPEGINSTAHEALDWVNGSIGVTMWMNNRSALLQTISSVNFINWGDNNVLAAGKTLLDPKKFGGTFMELMNSDFLKQRRDGLEINVEDAAIAKAIEKGGSSAPKRLYGALIKAGFKPTQIADSFAIAAGGTPFFINRTKTYQKEMTLDKDGNSVRKYTDIEAKEKAFNDFRSLAEEHQQSSRQDRVSNVQTGVLGRLVFAFNNTPMQMTRLQKKAARDIINNRGDLKTNVSKLVYYGVVQSAIFYALQQGAYKLLFDKDEDDPNLKTGEKEYLQKRKSDSYGKILNGMIDSSISGSGMQGKVIIAAKNSILKYLEESKKGYRADYSKVVNEAVGISPPLSTKLRKATSGLNEFKRLSTKKGQLEVQEAGTVDSPYIMPAAKVTSALTNIPIDRFISKLDNLNTAINDKEVEDWQRIALALGWDKWSLGMYEDEFQSPEEIAQETKEKKEAGYITGAMKRKETLAKKKAEFEKLPQRAKDSIAIDKFLKKEERKKLLEKAEKKAQRVKDSINIANYLKNK
jgi:hypothetical protein